MGYCPGCSHLVAYRQGCEACKFKDEDLLQKPPTPLSSDEEEDTGSEELEDSNRKGKTSQPTATANARECSNKQQSKRSRSPASSTKSDNSSADAGSPKRKREGRNNQRHAPSSTICRTANHSAAALTLLTHLTIISLQMSTLVSNSISSHTNVLVTRQHLHIKGLPFIKALITTPSNNNL